jgi:hypothetical protein
MIQFAALPQKKCTALWAAIQTGYEVTITHKFHEVNKNNSTGQCGPLMPFQCVQGSENGLFMRITVGVLKK